MKTVNWHWPHASLGGGADGSSMSKLFRGQQLSDTALLAREAVQNSTDAARKFAETHLGVDFRVVFRFATLFGDEKAAVVEALDLRGMNDRRAEYARHSKDPLQTNALDHLDDPKSGLPLLYVEDYGTHGLSGHPKLFKKSHLFMAMYYIGSSDKGADQGGSYGFGKSALERASRTHSVIAHTAFEPTKNDPVRSRLIGFSWWPDLQVDEDMFAGRASFSNHPTTGPGQEAVAAPFDDADADAIASSLGFQPRDPSDPAQLGTSFLIVDPAIDPEELISQLEKWWWPALEESLLDVEVVLPSGEVKVPKPASNPFVAQFIRPFRIATGVEQPGDPNKEQMPSKKWRNRSGVGGSDLGALALVVPDTAIDEDSRDADGTPLVALTRGPRMVIQYMTGGTRRRVPLRGVFVANDRTNDLLRETEPSSHDRWTTNASNDVSDEATATANAVITKIRSSVSEMAKAIAPTPPKQNQALSHFSKLMSITGSKRGPVSPPQTGGERIELTFPDGRPAAEKIDEQLVRVRSAFNVRVADAAKKEACQVRIACQMFIHEDEGQGTDKCAVSVRPVGKKHGFVQETDGAWVGVITKAESVKFAAESEPYPNLWTVSMQPTATRIGEWSDK